MIYLFVLLVVEQVSFDRLVFSFSAVFPDEVAAYEIKQKEAEAKKERLYVTSSGREMLS